MNREQRRSLASKLKINFAPGVSPAKRIERLLEINRNPSAALGPGIGGSGPQIIDPTPKEPVMLAQPAQDPDPDGAKFAAMIAVASIGADLLWLYMHTQYVSMSMINEVREAALAVEDLLDGGEYVSRSEWGGEENLQAALRENTMISVNVMGDKLTMQTFCGIDLVEVLHRARAAFDPALQPVAGTLHVEPD